MSIPVAVLGATGLVGQRLLTLLEDHPTFELVAVTGSEHRVGEPFGDEVTWRVDAPMPAEVASMPLEQSAPAELSGDPEVVLSALPGSVAGEIEPAFAEAGALVCSNASFDRLAPDVPLIIPEVNAEHIHLLDHQRDARGWDGALVKNPNCTSAGIAIPLAALDGFGLDAVTAVTMQSISGAGARGVYAIDAIDNVIPNIPGEAEKVRDEPAKVLGSYEGDRIEAHPVDIRATCHRVPVIDGHLASLWVDLEAKPTEADVVDAFDGLPSSELPSAPPQPLVRVEGTHRPRPRYDRDLAGGMSVAIGPVEIDGSTVQFESLSHNTLRGAGGACLLAAELAVVAGYA